MGRSGPRPPRPGPEVPGRSTNAAPECGTIPGSVPRPRADLKGHLILSRAHAGDGVLWSARRPVSGAPYAGACLARLMSNERGFFQALQFAGALLDVRDRAPPPARAGVLIPRDTCLDDRLAFTQEAASEHSLGVRPID